ncbi:MAG TPA: hypothetical protein VK750_07700 [Cytophagaceae bacterium]|nr:hypothetical protein [Cytophagaceae bacterium]
MGTFFLGRSFMGLVGLAGSTAFKGASLVAFVSLIAPFLVGAMAFLLPMAVLTGLLTVKVGLLTVVAFFIATGLTGVLTAALVFTTGLVLETVFALGATLTAFFAVDFPLACILVLAGDLEDALALGATLDLEAVLLAFLTAGLAVTFLVFTVFPFVVELFFAGAAFFVVAGLVFFTVLAIFFKKFPCLQSIPRFLLLQE